MIETLLQKGDWKTMMLLNSKEVEFVNISDDELKKDMDMESTRRIREIKKNSKRKRSTTNVFVDSESTEKYSEIKKSKKEIEKNKEYSFMKYQFQDLSKKKSLGLKEEDNFVVSPEITTSAPLDDKIKEIYFKERDVFNDNDVKIDGSYLIIDIKEYKNSMDETHWFRRQMSINEMKQVSQRSHSVSADENSYVKMVREETKESLDN